MSEILEWVRPIFSGLIGALCVYFLVRFASSQSRVVKGRKVLEFSPAFRIFSLVSVLIAIFISYAAYHARESQILYAAIIGVLVISGAMFFVYQAFFVRFSYTNKKVFFSSPIAGNKSAPWSALSDVGYSHLLQADYIQINGIGRIWCSNMLNGYAELGEFLNELTDKLDRQNV